MPGIPAHATIRPPIGGLCIEQVRQSEPSIPVFLDAKDQISCAIDPCQPLDRPVIQPIIIQNGRDTLFLDNEPISNGLRCS